MSKGLSFAIYLVQMNLDRTSEELLKILKHYIKELEELADV